MFVPVVPDAFSEDTILLYVMGKQNFNRAKAMIACGDVYDFHFFESEAGQWDYKAFVHAEMVANKNYLIRVSLAHSSILTTKCVCKAFKNKHNKCKHVVALLLTLFLFAKCPNSPPKWITNQRRKLVPMKCPPDWAIYKKIKFDLDWDGIKQGFFKKVPKHNDKALVLITSPEVKKRKKKDPEKKQTNKKESQEKKSQKEKESKIKEREEEGVEKKRKRKRECEEPLQFGPTKRKKTPISYPKELEETSQSKKEEW